ncbi:MAG: hypothetical protein M1825_002366 [Sarcosagium campestre]|nr:MAG: hypothetical protein M1825_002366 [Sarcosagium campestre]
MTGKDRVLVALYRRQGISHIPEERAKRGHASFHWGFLVVPKKSQAASAFDVKLDPPYVNIPGSGGWQYHYTNPVDSSRSQSILGAVFVGKLPQWVHHSEVDILLKQIHLPLEGRIPVENCVSWISQAIVALPQSNYIEDFDIDTFLDAATEFADDCLQKGLHNARMSYVDRRFP